MNTVLCIGNKSKYQKPYLLKKIIGPKVAKTKCVL